MKWWMKYQPRRLRDEAGDDGDKGGGGGGDPNPNPEKTPEGDNKGGNEGDGEKGGKPSDAEVKLLREVMKHKTSAKELADKLKAFDGIDPDMVKQLIADKAAADQAKAEAEKAELEKKGEWERLKAQMAEENGKVVTSIKTELTQRQSALDAAQAQIVELTIGQNFTSNGFIKDELTLTPSKARTIYGSHFEITDGQMVAYDKPRGAANRTPLVDAAGEHLTFDAAIRKLVDADPDRDSILRAKAKPGAGSGSKKGGETAPTEKKDAGLSPTERIAAGLAGLAKQKK